MGGISNKTKAILLIAVFLLLIAIVMVFLLKSKDAPVNVAKNETKTQMTIGSVVTKVPDVNQDNITIYASTTELTTDPVVIQAIPKLTDYKLYYYVKETQTDEERNNATENDSESTITPIILEPIEKVENSDYEIYAGRIALTRNARIYFKYERDGKFSEKSFEISIENIMKKEDVGKEEEEEITQEELDKNKVDTITVQNSTSLYMIRVNYGANTVTVYKRDDDGNYSVPIKAMVCSCGTATPTSGTYKTSDRYTWRALVGNVYGKYATRIVGSILFHSVPYTAIDNGSLEWWEYDRLGSRASAGCVRLTVADAKWIYDNCAKGTLVEFYSDTSNPGPLGKPTAQKISDNEACRGWDPTDYSAGNPWFNQTQEPEEDTYTNTLPGGSVQDPEEETPSQGDTTVTIIPQPTPTPEEPEDNSNTSIGDNTTDNNNTDGNTSTDTPVEDGEDENTTTEPEENTNTNTNTNTGRDHIIIGENTTIII